MSVAILTAVGTFLGAGLVLIAGGLGFLPFVSRPRLDDDDPPDSRPGSRSNNHRRRRDLIAAGLCSLLALVITRWPMSVPLALLGVLGSRGLAGGATRTTIERLEAIAAWTEMLRDTLAAAAGLTQALVATAAIAPRPLRSAVGALVARLDAGVAIVPALAQLAEDIGDPAADTVVACLIMAASERAQRLTDLLGALAESTRNEVAMRLSVEASRSAARTAVRMITGFSFGLLGLMAVFARSYLSPYHTSTGQLVLVIVGFLYGLGLWMMSAMVRSRPFPRLQMRPPRAS
ncbi:MAG TPA: type II secretion system F family protein [Acidimicrobiales bacterium]|nr:type II secretion system F family protein [Acidimicrobiales bacterium]